MANICGSSSYQALDVIGEGAYGVVVYVLLRWKIIKLI